MESCLNASQTPVEKQGWVDEHGGRPLRDPRISVSGKDNKVLRDVPQQWFGEDLELGGVLYSAFLSIKVTLTLVQECLAGPEGQHM